MTQQPCLALSIVCIAEFLMSTPDKVLTPCPSCGAKLSVPSTAAGKKIRCPKCQTVVAITADMVNQPPEVAAPPVPVPQSAQRPDVSLSDENTYAGAPQKKHAPESLGDQATYGGKLGSDDVVIDDDMEIVDLAGRYKVEGVLGKGGMGEVLLATDTRLNRKVAIKRMLGDAAKSRTAVSRFLIEAKSIAALNHPNIVQIYDYGRAKDGPFLILEYVEGKSLLERCQKGAIPLEKAIDLTCQLCDGLGKAHDANIIHRDIKPANVLLTTDGIPKLTDFGLAKDEAADGGLSVAGAVLGTLDFMPPEQRKDAALTDARSDLWSLAATLYQMVTGKTPKIIRFKDVPQSLQDVLGKALEDEKDDRYQSAREFREALKSCLLGTPTSPVPVAELGAGECAKCRTRNDANRKFCSKCAAPLRVNCLQCSEQIPVWDNVCGDCGGKQSDLLPASVAEFASQRERAEAFRSALQFQSALELARAVAAVQDERLAEHKPWAISFIAETEAEWQRQQDSARQHFSEAKKHRDAFDYDAGIHAIESIPEPLRSAETYSYLHRLEEEKQESIALLGTIKDRVNRGDLDGLLAQVQRAVELRGDHADLQKLKMQLNEREVKLTAKLTAQRDAAYRQAAIQLESGHATEGLRLVESVQMQELRESDQLLQTKLKEIVAVEDTLTELVQRCKADGVLSADEVIEMYLAVEKYLRLNPRHQKIARMRYQLLQRMRKPEFICRASAEWLSQLEGESLSQLPLDVLSRFPVKMLAPVIAQLPVRQNSIGMQFKRLPGGVFTMGNGGDAHQVTLTNPFELGVYEVTQEQYESVMGENPSNFKGPQNPVERVSLFNAAIFCLRLSALPEEKQAGRLYRLPTEAEWEYACRAGTETKYSFGDEESLLGDYGWYGLNSGKSTHPVGQKKPNAWGLYDMYGNVWEWCSDWNGDEHDFGSVSLAFDPAVSRGGGCYDVAANCRTAYRSEYTPALRITLFGFRVALSLPSGITSPQEAEQDW
jgi:formylglycine-generating enzyme required for sulfatase activity